MNIVSLVVKICKLVCCVIVAVGLNASVFGAVGGRPVLTTAGIVHVGEKGDIVLIERGKAPWGLALFGGHVENESPEAGFMRELQEELNIEEPDVYNFSLLGIHGNPGRDFRQHSVEATYVCCAHAMPRAGSDAKSVMVYTINEVRDMVDKTPELFAFDHAEILKGYLNMLGDRNPCAMKLRYGVIFEE